MADSETASVVWITGAGSGMGRALALEYARRGASVALSGRRRDRVDSVAAEIEQGGGRALAILCDVTDPEAVAAAVKKVVDRFGRLDVAIANAGFGIQGNVEELDADDWRRQLETNVVGVAMTARFALPHLTETKGRLAIVGSVMSMLTLPGQGAYAASKYAARAIGQTLSMEWRSRGVSCTTIHPGFVETEIARVDRKGRFRAEWKDRRPKRLMWSADRAARTMANAITKRRRELVFTAHGCVGAWFGRHLPALVHFAVTRFGGNLTRPPLTGDQKPPSSRPR